MPTIHDDKKASVNEHQEAQSPRLQSRTVFLPSYDKSIARYSDLLQKVITGFSEQRLSFSSAISQISNISLELLGHDGIAAEQQSVVTKNLIDEAKAELIKGIQTEELEVNPTGFTTKHHLTSTSGQAGAILLSNLFQKITNRFTDSDRKSISCADLDDLIGLANSYVPKDETAAKSVKESVRVQSLTMKLLLHAIANSDSTMTNSANNIINMFEKFLSSVPATQLEDPKTLALYTRAYSQYINLAVSGSISTPSLNSKIVRQASTALARAYSNAKVFESPAIAIETHHSIESALADLTRTTLGITVKGKNGLGATERVREQLSRVFQSATEAVTSATTAVKNEIPSSTTGILALANSLAQKTLSQSTELNKGLGVASDRLTKIDTLIGKSVSMLSASVNNLSHEYINTLMERGDLGPSKGGVNLNKERHLMEIQYAKIGAVLTEELRSMIATKRTAALAQILKKLAVLRQHLSEKDTIIARNAITSVLGTPEREVYGIGDKVLELAEFEIIKALRSQDLNVQQSLDLVEGLSLITQNRYAKYRNKPALGVFLQSDTQTRGLINKMKELVKTATVTKRSALDTFISKVYAKLSKFEHSDATTTVDGMMRSSKGLLTLALTQESMRIQAALSAGEDLTNDSQQIKNLQTYISAYADEFIVGRTNAIGAATTMFSSAFTGGPLAGHSPLELTARTLAQVALLEFIKAKPGSETPARLALASSLDNSILRSLKNLPDVLLNPSKELNKVEVDMKVKRAITHAISSIASSSASKMTMLTANNLALCYIGSMLAGKTAEAEIYMAKFQRTEHQPTQVCTTKAELDEIIAKLKP